MTKSILKSIPISFYMHTEDYFIEYMNYCSEKNKILNILIDEQYPHIKSSNRVKSHNNITINTISLEISFNKFDSPSVINLKKGFMITTDMNDCYMICIDGNISHPNKVKKKPELNLKLVHVR